MGKVYHFLNGELLSRRFPLSIGGQKVICRECLVDGPVYALDEMGFWYIRAGYLSSDDKPRYFQKVHCGFEKLRQADEKAEINLWFGDDLFCQVNMWFTLHWLSELTCKINRIPRIKAGSVYCYFSGYDDAELAEAYLNRMEISDNDRQLASGLWNAYRTRDVEALERLSLTQSQCFPDLVTSCDSAIAMFPRTSPGVAESILKEILSEGCRTFPEIYSEFSQRAENFGFADRHIKKILRRLDWKEPVN